MAKTTVTTEKFTTQTLTEGANITLGGRSFEVHFSEDGSDVFLYGKRGAMNFLRGFTNAKGVYEIISWNSGAQLRNKFSQIVRVFQVGDTITEMTK